MAKTYLIMLISIRVNMQIKCAVMLMQYIAIYDGFKNDKFLVTKCSKHRSRL